MKKEPRVDIIAFALGAFGLIAFIRTEKLIKTLKSKGLLDQDYKAD